MARSASSTCLLWPLVSLPLATPAALSTVAATVDAAGMLPENVKLGTVFTDGDKCFLDAVTYDLCCLPEPRDDCWDEHHTADKCCHGMVVTKPKRSNVPHDDPFNCFGLGGLTYEACCTPSPNPKCWDGDSFYTAEKCCTGTLNIPPARTEDTSMVSRGNPECWFGRLNFEFCCLPVPQEYCFQNDLFFTAERCCSENSLQNLSPLERLREELLTDVDPYAILDTVQYHAENHYPDSHLTAEIIRSIIGLLSRAGHEVSLWLEVGSFLGGSAITTAATVKAMNLPIGIVALDPWTGDVGMWNTRKAMRVIANHPYADSALKMDQFGHSRIYETFLANVRSKGHHDIIMPFRATSIVGFKVMQHLKREARIQVVPQVIYLDSAHEEGETLLEVRTAWELLPSPGILCGDDWSWEGVRTDVISFARSNQLSSFSEEELRMLDTVKQRTTQPQPGIALISEHDGTWIMFKRR